MKKILMLFAGMCVSLIVVGQTQSQNQTQNRKETQTQVQTGEQNGTPVMVQERIRLRENEGQGTITRAEKRKMKKENHGMKVSETAKQNRAGVMKQPRDRDNFQSRPKPMHAKPVPHARPVTPPRGRR